MARCKQDPSKPRSESKKYVLRLERSMSTVIAVDTVLTWTFMAAPINSPMLCDTSDVRMQTQSTMTNLEASRGCDVIKYIIVTYTMEKRT